MTEPVTISREAPANKGLDFDSLKEEGLRLVQQLAGEVWTDYNEHDPGVTTLEQLCYALTELSYRAELPLADLLAEEKSGKINTRRQALFIPRRILPCSPVTENDYRKLLVDRIPQIANVWLTPHGPDKASVTDKAFTFVNGLYDIALYVPNADPCACDEDYHPDEIRKRVRRVYCRYRNLCEDVQTVSILKPIRTVVRADVYLADTCAAEAVLASLFFELGSLLAPELRRLPLKSLLDLGQSADEIFNGPLLRNGFIDDDQLKPKATTISIQEIISVMAQTEGVDGVGNVSVVVGDNPTPYKLSTPINIAAHEILQLDTRPDEQLGGFRIRLFRNGIECKPAPSRVKRELDKLWTAARRTYKLMPQYETFFAVPRGLYREVEQYFSIQNQYPNVYGINAFGLPSDASDMRRGQAKQLKGYLLVFEQLLADFFAQLAHVKDLYSLDKELRQTYFSQSLAASVPNVEPLLKENYTRGLDGIVQSQEAAVSRRNRFLDFLLALYAYQVEASTGLTGCDKQDAAADEESIRVKLALLRYMVLSTQRRGRAFDYLALPSTRNIAGMEIQCRLQLGMADSDQRPLIEVLAELELELVETSEATLVGGSLNRYTDHIEENFVPATSLTDTREFSLPANRQFAQGGQWQRTQPVTKEFMQAAGDIENFRVGSLPGESTVTLVCKSPTESGWHLAGKYDDLSAALAALSALVARMRALHHHSQQLYLVEHNLLRLGRSKRHEETAPHDEDEPGLGPHQTLQAHEQDSGEVDFEYSFTLTAIISALPRRLNDDDYRKVAREVIKRNLPAHLVADICFLHPVRMGHFEALYWAWRRALRRRHERDIIQTSHSLRRFLIRCRRRAARSSDGTTEA